MPDWTSYFSLIKIWVKKITKEASKRETDSDYITFNIKTNQLNGTHKLTEETWGKCSKLLSLFITYHIVK